MIPSLVAVGIVLAVLALILLSTYNSLTQQRQEVRTAWAKMDEQLKNRYDLMPGLIMAVQANGGEAATKLPSVNSAKNQAAVAFNPAQLASAEIALTIAIHEVLREAQSDPALMGDLRFIEIRQDLARSEKRVDQACKRYNDAVAHLNESLTSFPMVFTATLIGLKPQPAFELPIETR
jgi:LemA protein